jgi:protocatechuate 3,4-dioxygenase beta subunit
MTDETSHRHDLGLAHDAPRLLESALGRRRVLTWLAAGGAGLAASATLPGARALAAGECALPARETAGPFPAHGSNRGRRVANVLADAGIVRRDIRPSFGAASGVAEGVPFDLTIRLLDANDACRPLAGHVVYLWHCTADSRYSLYEEGVTDQNFLRGVQAADANGELTFTTVFPGCYRGRYPHFHFEVFPGLDLATVHTNRVITSQIALPRDACDAVYTGDEYGDSAERFASTSIERDGVFRDNTPEEMAVMTADVTGAPGTGLEGRVTIGIPTA